MEAFVYERDFKIRFEYILYSLYGERHYKSILYILEYVEECSVKVAG